MFVTILSLILVAILMYSFIDIRIGIALYLAYMVLVPYVQIQLGGLHFGDNLANITILAAYFYFIRKHKLKYDWKPLIPFGIYYIVSLVLMPFQSSVPFAVMANSLRVDIMQCLIVPFVMWNVIRYDRRSISTFRNTIIIVIGIAIIYGLFLTMTVGLNPYIMFMASINDIEIDMEDFYEAADEGRIFGRISSVFVQPMTFALFLGFSFIYTYYIRKRVNIFVSTLLFFAIVVMALLCGVRSVLGGLVVAVGYYLVIGKNYKLLLPLIGCFIIGSLIISQIPELSTYLSSMTDVEGENEDVRGSSIEMRLRQLEGALSIASTSPLVGQGFGWTGYYVALKGPHPVCLAFESLIYVIICNQGLVGIILWAYMAIRFMKYNKRLILKDRMIINSLFVFYIVYACITGEYGYMHLFVIFYVLMLGETAVISKRKRKTKKNISNERKQSKSTSDSTIPASVSSVS